MLKLGVVENIFVEYLVVVLVVDGSVVFYYEGVMQGIFYEKWCYYEFGYLEEEVKNKIWEKGKLFIFNLNEVLVKVVLDMLMVMV